MFMFRSFIISMLSGERGPSSKRGVMMWLLLMFTFVVIVNLFTGKQPDPMFSKQLHELLLVAMGIVFGEKFITTFNAIQNRKSTTQTTVIAPSDSTVVASQQTSEPIKQ